MVFTWLYLKEKNNKFYMKQIITTISLFIGVFVALAQPQDQTTYYNGVDFNLNGVLLKNALATKITNTHVNQLTYNNVWNALKQTDKNPSNNNQVILVYGHEGVTTGKFSRVRAKNDNGGNNGQWNREHVYARSLGTPDLGSSGPGSDAHHIRASDVQLNGDRGNRKFTSGTGNSGTVSSFFYPGNEWKGDVARMMMYMYLRYGNQCLPTNVGVGTPLNAINDQMIPLFLQWNAEDPVSEIEIQRNTYLGNASNSDGQGNRNPFIDNPYLATKIWGGPLAEDRWGTLSTNDVTAIEFGIYPNPATDHKVYIQTNEQVNLILIHSIDGKLIQQIQNPQFENNQLEISNLNSGFYIITLKTDNKSTAKKLIVK